MPVLSYVLYNSSKISAMKNFYFPSYPYKKSSILYCRILLSVVKYTQSV